MESFNSDPSEDLSQSQASNLFISDLIKLQQNLPIRFDLMKAFLEYSLFSHSKTPNTELLFSVPANPIPFSKAIILFSSSTQVLISPDCLFFINCPEDIQTLCKKHFPKSNITTLCISEEKDPYYALSLCWLFSSTECLLSSEWSSSADLSVCKAELKEFIYSVSETTPEDLRTKLEEIQTKMETGEVFVKEEKNRRGESWELDNESTYEESFNQVHGFHKNWDIQNRELYKVTEFNESLECSVSDEGSDLAAKLSDFSMKATNSITDRFPKFSFASLSLSETSYQNAYESYKKSLNYNEQVDLLVSPQEKVESDSLKLYDSYPVSSTQICTLSDTNNFKSALESRSEHCNCTKCGIF